MGSGGMGTARNENGTQSPRTGTNQGNKKARQEKRKGERRSEEGGDKEEERSKEREKEKTAHLENFKDQLLQDLKTISGGRTCGEEDLEI